MSRQRGHRNPQITPHLQLDSVVHKRPNITSNPTGIPSDWLSGPTVNNAQWSMRRGVPLFLILPSALTQKSSRQQARSARRSLFSMKETGHGPGKIQPLKTEKIKLKRGGGGSLSFRLGGRRISDPSIESHHHSVSWYVSFLFPLFFHLAVLLVLSRVLPCYRSTMDLLGMLRRAHVHRNPSLLSSRLLVFANKPWNFSVRCFSTPTQVLLRHEKTLLLSLLLTSQDGQMVRSAPATFMISSDFGFQHADTELVQVFNLIFNQNYRVWSFSIVEIQHFSVSSEQGRPPPTAFM